MSKIITTNRSKNDHSHQKADLHPYDLFYGVLLH